MLHEITRIPASINNTPQNDCQYRQDPPDWSHQGLGEQFARYFHSKGKTVIAAGRRQECLNALQAELKGLETFQFDAEDTASIESNLRRLFKTHPDVDAFFVMAGKMEMESFSDPSTSSAAGITSQITVNMAAPIVIARTVVPHLLSLKRKTTFITVTSGLAFVPLPIYPVYNATKAGQMSMSSSSLPPYVDTDLDTKFRAKTIELQGGPDKAHPPMPLKEYMDITIAQFEEGPEKEVATGFSAVGVGAWRGAFGLILKQFGFTG